MVMMMMTVVIAIGMTKDHPESVVEAREIDEDGQEKVDPELITATSPYEYT
ncbi:hypothetical protein KIN20_030846 [Parelaphostrongylus tenuis]|uniref:Uncharacterized protein n=1 Tax=Parelaphostrongylus tenuis TaxID=148309 RepID=A0AAD5R606_PARTN|nr:hypothetical protein KIN20_030846 [Parelaphostrongylus tenuis]